MMVIFTLKNKEGDIMLEMKDLTYIYEDGTVALKDVSIDLDKGKRIGIIGSNGAGKSTLFLNFTGVLRPKKGEIRFNGQPVKYSKDFLRKLRQYVGIVFQDPDKQIFFSTVYDDAAFGLRNLGVPEDEIKLRVEKALKSVGADEFSEKPVHFLSHGQKKRVAIAGVIAMDNSVIFFDEPSAGLDPTVTEAVEDILISLSEEENKKIVISSHDMDLIYKICDYVYVLDHGRVIAQGSTDEVFLMDDILEQAGLSQPWLVKIHVNMHYPLFKTEQELYSYHTGSSKKSI